MARYGKMESVVLDRTEVTGLKELTEALLTLPDAIQKEAERTGVRNGLEAIAEEIRARAPKGDRGSIRYARRFRRANKALHKRIFVRMGAKARSAVSGVVSVTAPHAHLVEFGHRIVTNKKAKPPKGPLKDTGKRAVARPFVRPGFAAKETEALDKLIDSINEALDKHW